MSRTKNLRLILENAHDAATLTATSAAPGAPVDATQRSDRSRVWRSVGAGVQVIEGVFDNVVFIDSLYMLRHNLSGTGLVRFEPLLGGEVAFDSGERPTGEIVPAGVWRAGIDPWGATYNAKLKAPLAIISGPVVAADGYRITITDPENADGAFEIGRIVIGLVFAPKFNASYGLSIDHVDRAKHEYSVGQTLRTINGGNPRKQASFDLDWLEAEDRSRLIEELAQRGMIADVLVDLYPESTGLERLNGAFLARLTAGYGDTHDIPMSRKTSLSFLEV